MFKQQPQMVEETQKELEAAYEKALRYALLYNRNWEQLDEAAARLRAFLHEQGIASHEAA